MDLELALPIQHLYPEEFSYCYGCGRLNPQGYHIETYWDGEEGVTRFTPRPYHTAVPGFVYGGLLASLMDCHSTGVAAWAWAQHKGIDLRREPAPRFVTASLHVDFKKPTPLGPTLVLRGRPVEIGRRKVVVESTLTPEGHDEPTVTGRVVLVLIPETMKLAGDPGARRPQT